MQKSFLHVKKRAPGSYLFVVLLIGAILAFGLWIFVSVNPFQPTNPFLRQVTIGQSVIGDWRYGGADPNGAMKFYDAYQYVTIPANSPKFAADGEFVTLDGHTPSTLTFEPAYESEIIGPASYVWILLAVAAVLALVWRKSRLTPAKMRKQRKRMPSFRHKMK